jgi:hypothetical protein
MVTTADAGCPNYSRSSWFTFVLMDKELLTIAPVAKSCGAIEFTDTDGLRSMFGIKRSLAYELLGAGAIRGVSLRRRGRSRGKRLFDVASVRAYLNSCGEPNE